MGENEKIGTSKRLIVAGVLCVVFMLVCTIGGIIFFKLQINKSAAYRQANTYRSYEKYYVMIPSERKSSFWEAVYKSASEIANENNAYLEMFGANLSESYSETQLMRMAIEANVDGIILEANETEEMTVLINANAEDTSQNMIYSSIQETIEGTYKSDQKINISAKALNSQGAFAAEEAIRDIFMGDDKLPDIIICLNEINTTCVYLAVVDYNKVGVINIIGYYDSQTILKAIERNVIYATVSVDAKALGEYCIDALTEFDQMGHVSNYYSVDTAVIHADNVREYLGGDASEE